MRRSRQALVDYFRILQEWSLKDQSEGLVGDQGMVSGAAPKVAETTLVLSKLSDIPTNHARTREAGAREMRS